MVPLTSGKPNQAVLLVEETLSMARTYSAELAQAGFHTVTVRHVAEIEAACAALRAAGTLPALGLIDLKRADPADFTAIDILRHAPHGKARPIPVIIMTDHGSINCAVEAIRRGASDFLVRPFGGDRLRAAIRAVLEQHDPRSIDPELAGPQPVPGRTPEQVTNPAANPAPPAGARPGPVSLDFGGFIGLSRIMQDLYEKIEHVAHSHAPVFVTGESGTGKEVCAEAIHRHSRRAGAPFIAINCAAIPRDLIESELFGHVKGAFTGAINDHEGAARRADGGTLFLDEIAEMHPDMQTKLLRFLQNQAFTKVGGSKQEQADVRIICATNRDPLAETRTGRFREDLYYRLHVLPLHMPPLRERGDDVIDIAEVLIRRFNEEEGKNFRGLADDAALVLRAYAWPGNIRQLQNVIRNIIVMHDGELVTGRMLPPVLQQRTPHAPAPDPAAPPLSIRPLAEVERETIETAIDQCGGNIPRAAALLGISPSTIYRKKQTWL